ncbi:MAG: TolC family protein [Saprospiraceae bacterium]
MKTNLIVIFLLVFNVSKSQNPYSLDQCIAIALKNSNVLYLTDLAHRESQVDVSRAKAFKLPSASAGVGHGLNFGRSIDPSTNGFINEQITRGGFSGNAYLPLWQANQLNNNLKSFQFAEEANRWSVKNEEANLKLRVTVAYMQILNYKELTTRAELQEGTTTDQVTRLRSLDAQGAIIPSQLTDLQGQYALDQLNTFSAKQEVKASKLALCQLMNIPYGETFDITDDSNLNIGIEGVNMTKLNDALSHHPMVKYRELEIKSAELGLAAAKAQQYPQLGISFNLGSNYSSAYRLNGEKVNYPKQLSNNINYSTLLSLNVPIIDGYRIKSQIKKSEIAIDRAKANTDLARNTIQQQVEEAKFLFDGAQQKYKLAESQVNSFQESFRIAETRFNNGTTNSTVEYILAKNNLARALNLLTTSKYEWVFRKKVLEFYSNIE